ncbi:MAG: cadmium-translocating P-type ATPase [Lachnospiraceae bacterium]|nr:cadmium-translocating P-type ATPase [Lachnospiraceae bacterium]
MTMRQKRTLLRIGIAAVLFAVIFFLPFEGIRKTLLLLIPFLVVGWDVLYDAVRGVLHGELLDEKFLMTIASVGAIAIGEAEEGVFVMLFYQIGELFQSVAVTRSRRSVAALMDIRPDIAHVERENETLDFDPSEVSVGETVVVRPGERIPLDGEVISGEALVDTSSLTGESVPRTVCAGDSVKGGFVDTSGLLRVRVTAPFEESTVSKILDLVENAVEKKAKAEHFITRFARIYTPAVVAAAVVCAFLPPLLGLGSFSLWIRRALIFLVISCPCALVISVPLGFFGGIGGASANGILIKGANFMEVLANAETVLFDKTGTLTKGTFRVTKTSCTSEIDKIRLLRAAASAEAQSLHPIAKSLTEALNELTGESPVKPNAVKEISGKGISADVNGKAVLCGNRKLLSENGISVPEVGEAGTLVYVAEDGYYLGWVLISDEIREDAANAVNTLRSLGVKKTVMLTGDNEKTAKSVAEAVGLDAYRASLLPEEKVTAMEEYLNGPERKGSLLYVGDGINDAPVLMRADVGIAMGGLGSDAAIEAADVVIMTDQPGKLPAAVSICRRTLRIVRENIVFALAVKILIMILGVLGIAGMWLAAFADVGVAVIAILNSMRTLALRGGRLRSAADVNVPR